MAPRNDYQETVDRLATTAAATLQAPWTEHEMRMMERPAFLLYAASLSIRMARIFRSNGDKGLWKELRENLSWMITEAYAGSPEKLHPPGWTSLLEQWIGVAVLAVIEPDPVISKIETLPELIDTLYEVLRPPRTPEILSVLHCVIQFATLAPEKIAAIPPPRQVGVVQGARKFQELTGGTMPKGQAMSLFHPHFSGVTREDIPPLKDLAMSRAQSWKAWAKALADDKVRKRFPVSTQLLALLMREARIFRVPPEMEHDSEKLWTFLNDGLENRALSMADSFILPFRFCAVYGPNDTIIFVGKMINNTDDAQNDPNIQVPAAEDGPGPGLVGWWYIMTLSPQPAITHRPGISENVIQTTMTSGAFEVTALGDGHEFAFSGNPTLLEQIGIDQRGHARFLWSAGDENAGLPVGREEYEDIVCACITRSALLALPFFILVQDPKNFIVELAPKMKLKPKRAKRGKRAPIPPLAASPIYLSMEPKLIRRTFGLEDSESGARRKRGGHERRAHMRFLTHKRYKWKRGQTIPVKGSWVGPTSGTTNKGREYRVLVDMVSPHVSGDDDAKK